MATTKARATTRTIPAAQGREVVEFLEQALGRPVEGAEVGAELQRVWRTAKAATHNADKARRAAASRAPREELARARRTVAEQLGRPDLLESIHRQGRPEYADSTDAPVWLQRPDGGPVTPESRDRELFTRAAVSPVSTSDGVEPVPFDYSTLSGVVGTPFGGGTPAVELNADLYPYRGRGLSYDQGQFMAAYRSDSVIREGVANLVSVMAGATVEVQAPSLTERQAELLGVDRDQLDTVAEALNVDLKFGRIDFNDAFEQLLRSGIVNGFGLYEFAMDPAAAIGQRITGLSPRLPNTVMRWIFDPLSSDLVGVQQTNPNGNIYQSGLAPFLDIRKTVMLSIDRDGDNFEGLSLVRSARGWDVLSMEVQSASILHWQRFGPGVPVLRRNSAAPNSAAASDAAFAALSQYANMSDAVLELGDGIDVELLQMQMDTGLEGIIDMCAKYKRSAIRDAISGLGTESAGAYNLGDVKSQMWLKGLGVFARQVERAWQNLIRVYCDLYFPGLRVYPTLRVTGFATRNASEVLNLQTTFGTLVQSAQYTDRELVEIAEKAEVIWHGRGREGDLDDTQTAPVADDAATPTGAPVEIATPTATPEAVEGKPAPGAAQRNAALGRRVRRDAVEKWAPTMADATLTKRIAAGEPLTKADLRDVESFFARIVGDPTRHPEWTTEGPFWQAFYAFGGQAMADWIGVELADDDGIPTAPDIAPDATPVTQEAETGTTAADENFADEAGEETGPELVEANTTTRAPEKYAHIDFTPPQGVREAARRGLEVRASKPPSERGGTEVGVARARDLANGRTVSPDTARRMKAYFDRHEVDQQGETWDEQGKGWQAWQLWGGDPGRSWSAKLVRQMNAADDQPRALPAYPDDPDAGTPDAPDATPRTLPGFGRTECNCGECAPTTDALTTRAKRPLFAVATRTGEFLTWRELTPVEQAVAFDRIADEKTAAVDRMTRAIESEQRAHRAAYAAAAQPLIDRRDVAAIAALDLSFTERYRQAMLPALRSLGEFATTDMLDEIAAQIGSRSWVATSDTATGSAAQVEAAATLAAKAVNDRVNEQLRGAALQVANGARPSTLTAAPMSIGNTAGGLLEQTASTTVNETRAVTAAEQGPRIVRAVYSAVMDRYTCDVCADADGTEVDYGSDRYRRLSPPNPRCRSVANSGGLRNLCQCVWVYEYEEPTVGPGPINPTPTGGLVVRSADSPGASPAATPAPNTVRLNLVVGLPGAGKSTWAASQSGVVIDRDAYVLTPEGYDPDGRAESLVALTYALRSAAPGETVHFVACLLTDTSRQAVVDHAIATADREVVATVTVLEVTPDHARRVNAERADSDRGAIPVEQLEHLIDAWQQPEAGAPGVVTIIA